MGSAKIMIVEDNTAVAEDCRDCIENLGYGVTSIVASGEESIKNAEVQQPDAVLMDIRLRGEMDGIEAAEQIYARFKIPVVFLSAYSYRELLERAKRVGSFGYLIKPLDERELYVTLEMALYRAKAEERRNRMNAGLPEMQKMAAIGPLAGGIAHQLNNALSGIIGNIDLFGMDSPGDENVADYAKAMKTSARRMIQLTAQLLAYAKGGKYQAKTISLSGFVKNALPSFQHAIDSAIHVDTDLTPNILNVKADLTQMRMVLSAVLANASEAIEGMGRIRVSCRKVAIADNIAKNSLGLKIGSYACLIIEDDGKGMDEETLSRIFEPFFTTKSAGRGLGMAAAYGIVKNHDGEISVDSGLGRGTAVKIYLPAIYSARAKPVRPPAEKIFVKKEVKPKAQWIKGTGTILVIDDEYAVMNVSRVILEILGYRVLEAKTGQEAIDMVKTFDGDIDLAMLDIQLPDMRGNAVYPLLMEVRPNLKVIVFSGYSIEGPVQEILNAGAEDFIQKPFTIAELSEKLQKVLTL